VLAMLGERVKLSLPPHALQCTAVRASAVHVQCSSERVMLHALQCWCIVVQLSAAQCNGCWGSAATHLHSLLCVLVLLVVWGLYVGRCRGLVSNLWRLYCTNGTGCAVYASML
jgi:hypothetical protein